MTTTDTRPSLAQRLAHWGNSLPSKPAIITVWGRDGWDTPQWPYVKLYAWRTADGFHAATNYEGDTNQHTFTTAADAAAWLDQHAHDGWALGYATPTHPAPFNAAQPDDMHRGPYIPAL